MTTLIPKSIAMREMVALLKLSIPLIITGFIESSVGFFSTLFLAHLGERELAAGAMVTWIFVTMMVVLWGALTSVSVLVSQKHGAKDVKGVTYAVRDGLLLATLFVIPATLLLWFTPTLLLHMGQDPANVALTESYMRGLVWGIFPDFTGLVLMQFLIGLGHTRSNLMFSLMWVPLNIFCNYVLMFGKLGLPVLGMVGIGWGTTIAYWISTLLLFFYLLWDKNYRVYFKGIFAWYKPRYLLELWQIGLPMGAMYCIEISFFMVLTLVAGKLGEHVLAANQIALQYMGVISVFTFAMAQAITVRIGHVLGQNDFSKAVYAAYLGIILGTFLMFLAALTYIFAPDFLISIDLNLADPKNAEVIRCIKEFFIFIAIFQILEATRFGFFGALRGFKDTRFTMLTSLVTFWGIDFPLGYFLAFYCNWGSTSFWWAMLLGECVGILLLFARFRYRVRTYERRQRLLQN